MIQIIKLEILDIKMNNNNNNFKSKIEKKCKFSVPRGLVFSSKSNTMGTVTELTQFSKSNAINATKLQFTHNICLLIKSSTRHLNTLHITGNNSKGIGYCKEKH